MSQMGFEDFKEGKENKEGGKVKHPFKTICCGGTFDPFHIGHKKFLEEAYSLGEKVVIGLTCDEMTHGKEVSSKIKPFKERKKNLEKYLESKGWLERTEIVEIKNPLGTAAENKKFQAIIVTEETLKNAFKINEERKKRRMNELTIIVVPLVKDSTGEPISSTRIRKGEINVKGEILRK